jgi:hypothetical protein
LACHAAPQTVAGNPQDDHWPIRYILFSDSGY